MENEKPIAIPGETQLSKPEYVPPTREQMKAVIRDRSQPEPVRRHLRTQLYGAGGGGRKATQQERLQRIKVAPGQHRVESVIKRPPGMSGRQWKKLQRVIREGRKVMREAKES